MMNLRFLYCCVLFLIACFGFFLGFVAGDTLGYEREKDTIKDLKSKTNRANLHIHLQDYQLDSLRKKIYYRDSFLYPKGIYWDDSENIYKKIPKKIKKTSKTPLKKKSKK